MKKNKTNAAWVHSHINDPYVKLAQKEGYRARAVYKLKEIDDEFHLIRPGQVVVDLGATPGSWSQYARTKMGHSDPGRVFALDLLPMEPIAGVDFLLGDFREESVLQQLEAMLDGSPVHLVISDMAPNLSGIAATDAARIELVAELAVDFARAHLMKKGALLIKTFHGGSYDDIVRLFRATFTEVLIRKPGASRSKSSETFILGRGLK